MNQLRNVVCSSRIIPVTFSLVLSNRYVCRTRTRLSLKILRSCTPRLGKRACFGEFQCSFNACERLSVIHVQMRANKPALFRPAPFNFIQIHPILKDQPRTNQHPISQRGLDIPSRDRATPSSRATPSPRHRIESNLKVTRD